MLGRKCGRLIINCGPRLLIEKQQRTSLRTLSLCGGEATRGCSEHQRLSSSIVVDKKLERISSRRPGILTARNMSSSSSRLTSIEDKASKIMGAAASRSISVDSTGDGLQDIAFRIVDQSRYPEILNLLYKNFHTDEPMSKTIGMIDEKGSRVPVLDEFTIDGLTQNLSIMAIDPVTDNLLGVSINVIAKKEDESMTLEEIHDKYNHPKFRHILTVLYRVNQAAGDVFKEMETDVFFDIKMVTTDKNQRRGGLATDLLRRSVELARNLGFKAVKTEATGLYSRKAFERLGFNVNAEYPYADYVSPEGEKVFESLTTPHRCTTLMTKRLLTPIAEAPK